MVEVASSHGEHVVFPIPTDEQITLAVRDYEIVEADGESVKKYLRSYPLLLSILTEARQKIADYFGESATARLSVSVDPELEDHRMLWVDVTAELSPDEIEMQEERFEDNWWLATISETQGLLEFDFAWKAGNEL